MKKSSFLLIAALMMQGASCLANDEDEAQAVFELAERYEAGKDVEPDAQKYFTLLQKAAELGHAKAQMLLALIYDNGYIDYVNTTPRDREKALHWYQAAAEQGQPIAQLYYGIILLHGKGVDANVPLALKYLESAAKEGQVNALFHLGRHYLSQHDESLAAKGIAYYKQAAEALHPDAQTQLALLHMHGIGMDRDVPTAVKKLQALAVKNNLSALFELALCYETGMGVEEDKKEALKYYMKAANLGNRDALFLLATRYESGLGLPTDEKKAVEFYKEAAENGHAEALSKVALFYLRGHMMERNLPLAFQYAQKSAEEGYAPAMFNLASFYESGVGTAVNKEKAIFWYQRAADLGDADAAKKVKKLKE